MYRTRAAEGVGPYNDGFAVPHIRQPFGLPPSPKGEGLGRAIRESPLRVLSEDIPKAGRRGVGPYGFY